MSLCQSNHQLSYAGINTNKMTRSNPTLKKALRINARKGGESIVTRLRSKLRTFYFQGEFVVQPFMDIDAVLMPYVLELVTRTEVCVGGDDGVGTGKYYTVCSDKLDSIYRLLRNCHPPELFSFPSTISKIREFSAKNALLEAETARQKQVINQLVVENEKLRSQISGLPNKRAKANND